MVGGRHHCIHATPAHRRRAGKERRHLVRRAAPACRTARCERDGRLFQTPPTHPQPVNRTRATGWRHSGVNHRGASRGAPIHCALLDSACANFGAGGVSAAVGSQFGRVSGGWRCRFITIFAARCCIPKNDTTCQSGGGSSKRGFNNSKGVRHVLDISIVCGNCSEFSNARCLFRSLQNHEPCADGSQGYSSFVVGKFGLAQGFSEMIAQIFKVDIFKE